MPIQKVTPHDNTIPSRILKCTCITPKCACLAKFRTKHPMHRKERVFKQTRPFIPTPDLVIQLIESTFIHVRYSHQAIDFKKINTTLLGPRGNYIPAYVKMK